MNEPKNPEPLGKPRPGLEPESTDFERFKKLAKKIVRVPAE
jgi:hypothetical protein